MGDGGFFTQRRPDAPPPPMPSAPAMSDGPPYAGIAALALVLAGVVITATGGNQGGLLGVPLVLIGVVLGAVAWGRGWGRLWGQLAVLGTLLLVALSVVATFLGL
jgi:hypothetical protein